MKYDQYNVLLKAYNTNGVQDTLSGNNFAFKLEATPTCSIN